MGFVFQAYNLLDALTAYDNVALPARLAGGKRRPAGGARRTRRGRPRGQAPAAGRPSCPVASSSGSRSRGRCTPGPAVLFADEPTGALDRSSGRQVLELLRRSSDEQGQTVVMVTHDPLAASYAHGVLFLADGQHRRPAGARGTPPASPPR